MRGHASWQHAAASWQRFSGCVQRLALGMRRRVRRQRAMAISHCCSGPLQMAALGTCWHAAMLHLVAIWQCCRGLVQTAADGARRYAGTQDQAANWRRCSGCRSMAALLAWRCAWRQHAAATSVLQWARANGCPWDEETCRRAVQGGHLAVLLWAYAHGCPCDLRACQDAVGRDDIVQWCQTMMDAARRWGRWRCKLQVLSCWVVVCRLSYLTRGCGGGVFVCVSACLSVLPSSIFLCFFFNRWCFCLFTLLCRDGMHARAHARTYAASCVCQRCTNHCTRGPLKTHCFLGRLAV